jgi:hypothetical protein
MKWFSDHAGLGDWQVRSHREENFAFSVALETLVDIFFNIFHRDMRDGEVGLLPIGDFPHLHRFTETQARPQNDCACTNASRKSVTCKNYVPSPGQRVLAAALKRKEHLFLPILMTTALST